MNKIINHSWDEFYRIPIHQKLSYFSKNNKIFDVLFSQQFDREFLDYHYHLTNVIRKISKNDSGKKKLSSILSNYRAMLYFIQPSTRTFLSFASACHILGIEVFDVRSLETSSELKGESFEDTIQTFSSFFDLIIMRYPTSGYAELASYVLNRSGRPVPVINAGSGKDQHPTQALLDIYTLRRSFENELQGDLTHKTIMMVGDLKRGRTVRSLSYLLTNFKNIRLIFSSPPTFELERDIVEYLQEKRIEVIESTEFEKHLPEVDAIYMTRVQNEYQMSGISEEIINFEDFSLHSGNISLLKKNAVILHPLPRRKEISPDIDHDSRSVYWRQVRNGMWTRAALLSIVLSVDKEVLSL